MTQNDEVVHPLNLDLRRHAGDKTSEKGNAIANLSEIDVRALYHELQVHQVELEMQNEELRRVHADLASSEEKYRDLYEFAPIGYLTLECSGKVLDANLTAASLLGIEREHLENNWFQAYLSQSSIPEFNAFCSHVIESDSKQTIELKLNPNGLNGRDRLWVLIEGKAIKDRIHNGFMMAVIDITERKRIEEALCQSEERYRRLFEVEFDAIFLIDCDSGRFIDANPAALKMYGYSQDEFLSLKASDISTQPDETQKAVAGRDEYIPLRWHRRKDGTVFPVEIAINCFDHKGRLINVAAIRDITARKNIEARLKQSESRYRTLFKHSPIPTLEEDFSKVKSHIDMLRSSGISDFREYFNNHIADVASLTSMVKVLDINQKGKEFFKIRDGDHVHTVRSGCFNDSSYEVFIEKLASLAEGDTRFESEACAQTKDGDNKIISLNLSVVPGYENTLSKVLVSIIDITERKKADESRDQLVNELESKNSEMERFIYTVSHDLRSPLITISGFVDLLRSDLQKGRMERVDEDLGTICSSVERMDYLLRDTLELSRIGRVTSPETVISFEYIANEALNQAANIVRTKQVEVEIDPDMPDVRVDCIRIVEVLINLIENSIKYMGDQPHPKVEIGYRHSDGAFFVKDNGIGIDPGQKDKIFELFYKIDKKSNGTGAGLAIAKRIIEVHGSHIWIESELAKGCAVLFTLPLSAGR